MVFAYNMQISLIGKRLHRVAGYCVEAGVTAEGSVAGVTEGSKYNLAFDITSSFYEALIRRWKDFLSWLDKHAGKTHYLNKAMKSIASLQDGWCITKSVPGTC